MVTILTTPHHIYAAPEKGFSGKIARIGFSRFSWVYLESINLWQTCVFSSIIRVYTAVHSKIFFMSEWHSNVLVSWIFYEWLTFKCFGLLDFLWMNVFEWMFLNVFWMFFECFLNVFRHFFMNVFECFWLDCTITCTVLRCTVWLYSYIVNC